MKFRLIELAVLTATLFAPACALAEEDSPMEVGIKEYTAGKYSDALGHLGGALNSEFNNAKLHYYMGNCYLKLNHKEAAVREFRIAYALDPTGTPGKYAKQTLDSMDVDKGASALFSKGLQDQKALSKAITDYEMKRGGMFFNPQPFNGYTPGSNLYPPGTGSGNFYPR